MDLIYTVAVFKERYFRLAQRLEDQAKARGFTGEFLIITDDSDTQPPGWDLKARLSEFVDVSQYDYILHIEPDVTITAGIGPLITKLKNRGKISVERREANMRQALGPDYPNIQVPYPGMVFVPGQYAVQFYGQWRAAYREYAPCDEARLFAGLAGLPWEFSDGMRIPMFEDKGQPLVHDRRLR